MSNKTIRSLFETRLKTWAAARSTPLPIAYENVGFSTPDTTYLRAFMLPGDTDSADLAGTLRNRVGVYQINIVCPANKGPGEGQGIAAELEALFPNNLVLTSSGFKVQTISPVRERKAIDADGRYTVPVDFAYRSDST